MKKYLRVVLLIAGLAVLGSINYFHNPKVANALLTVGASCNITDDLSNQCVDVGGTTYRAVCNGGVIGAGNQTSLCAGIIAGGGFVSNSEVVVSRPLNPNTTYYWRVTAGNAFGKSAPSKTFSFRTGGTAVTGVAGPSIITTGSVSSAQNFYSLLSSIGTWQNASGAIVSPKTVKQEVVYTDENNQRIFPRLGSQSLFNYFQNAVIGTNDDRPGAPLPACTQSNVNSVVGGFRCCKDRGNTYSWYVSWSGTPEQCAAITAGGSSTGTTVQ